MQQSLSIIITNPFTWPWVRRGSERLLHDLANYLSEQGDGVEVHAMGPTTIKEHRGMVIYHVEKQRLNSRFRQWNCCHYFALKLIPKLKHSQVDIVHCLNYFDAFSALIARKIYKHAYKVVFHVVGIPTKKYFRAVPLDKLFISYVLKNADDVWALSEFGQSKLEHEFKRNVIILPPPVDLARFSIIRPTHVATPYLLFVGDVDECRKGARVLCGAFDRLIKAGHDLWLRMSGRVSDETRATLLASVSSEAAARIEFLGLGNVDDLPLLYANARLTVLPAVWEAFGLVLIESLASGTPVVGARHGGITDIVRDPTTGALFDTGDFTIESVNVDGLTDAIELMLNIEKTESVRQRCAESAKRYSWQVLGEAYRARYRVLCHDQ